MHACNCRQPSVYRLPLVYSADSATCNAFAKALSQDKACRYEDAFSCSENETLDESLSVSVAQLKFPVIDVIASNEYGYTQVAKSSSSSLSMTSIIYVMRFQGDRSSRLMETSKVDTDSLNKVLSLPPGPIPYSRAQYVQRQADQELHAEEFAALLSKGEKIADDWSPVLNLSGKYYAMKRECSGEWIFGGSYACNRITKLTALRLYNEEKAQPVCEFAVRKRK